MVWRHLLQHGDATVGTLLDVGLDGVETLLQNGDATVGKLLDGSFGWCGDTFCSMEMLCAIWRYCFRLSVWWSRHSEGCVQLDRMQTQSEVLTESSLARNSEAASKTGLLQFRAEC